MRGVQPSCGPVRIQSLIISSLPRPSPPAPHRLHRLYRKPLHPPPLVATASPPPPMGSPRKEEEETNHGNEKNEMEAKEKGESAPAAESSSSPPPLQPPEKPLPGDCCGSGCVRCVWDIYYEELDAYNKALSSQSTGPRASN